MFDQRCNLIPQKTTVVQTHTKINKWKRTKVVTTWTPRKQTSVYPVSTCGLGSSVLIYNTCIAITLCKIPKTNMKFCYILSFVGLLFTTLLNSEIAPKNQKLSEIT
jgi:hypothetical protein